MRGTWRNNINISGTYIIDGDIWPLVGVALVSGTRVFESCRLHFVQSHWDMGISEAWSKSLELFINAHVTLRQAGLSCWVRCTCAIREAVAMTGQPFLKQYQCPRDNQHSRFPSRIFRCTNYSLTIIPTATAACGWSVYVMKPLGAGILIKRAGRTTVWPLDPTKHPDYALSAFLFKNFHPLFSAPLYSSFNLYWERKQILIAWWDYILCPCVCNGACGFPYNLHEPL